jgi:hypothetical protein
LHFGFIRYCRGQAEKFILGVFVREKLIYYPDKLPPVPFWYCTSAIPGIKGKFPDSASLYNPLFENLPGFGA